MRRLLALIALLGVFVVAVVVAVALATSTSNSVVKFRNVVGHDVNSAVSDVKKLISQYTK